MKKLSKKIYGSVINFSDKMLSQIRYKSINNRDFTIICNNCWAGYVYRRFNLPYNTPTVGLYFFASDFVKFCEKLHYYTEQPLNFISYKDSKYKEILIKRKHTEVPVAKIGDIEIVFLHYKDENEAREKWTRRVARINYDNLILKFSQMNYCTEEDLQRFDKIDAKKKICFLTEKREDLKSAIYFKSCKGQNEIKDDTTEYCRYVSLKKLINSKSACGNNFES